MQAIDETIEGGSTTERRSKCRANRNRQDGGGARASMSRERSRRRSWIPHWKKSWTSAKINLELMLRGEENGYGFPQG